VGKTQLSIAVAEQLRTELIYADSMAVYRGMDVGTAKPSPEERKRVPHHLIDVVDPDEEFGVQVFLAMASPVVDALISESKVPVVVGGTGLYLRALTEGLVNAPPADPGVMAEIEDLGDHNGVDYLHRELQKVDPEAAESIAPRDRRRLVRALSVFRSCGEPISSIRSRTTHRPDFRFVKVGLRRDRQELYERIDRRVDQMIDRGLVSETERLLLRGLSRSARQALGYKEIIDHLEGRTSLDESIARIKTRTRRFAKRQITWFRSDPQISWLDVTGKDAASEMMELVSGFLVELSVSC